MSTRAELLTSLAFACVMLVTAYSLKHARTLGMPVDPDLPTRLTMVMLGGYLVVSGNAIPRRFTARAAMGPHAARVQAGQRFAGWTFVLAGLAFAIAWIVLPTDVAEPLSVAFLLGGTLIVAVRLVRACRGA